METAFSRWLCSAIAGRMQDADLTQYELAQKIGCQPSTLSVWLAGKALPRRKSERLLAQYFRIDKATLRNIIHESQDVMASDAKQAIPAQVAFNDFAAMTPDEAVAVQAFLRYLRASGQGGVDIGSEASSKPASQGL